MLLFLLYKSQCLALSPLHVMNNLVVHDVTCHGRPWSGLGLVLQEMNDGHRLVIMAWLKCNATRHASCLVSM